MAVREAAGILLFEILKRDHDNITRAIEHMRAAPEDQQDALFGIVHGQLTLHMQMEERFFYPELDAHAELRQQVANAYAEHEQIKRMLRRLIDEELTSDEWEQDIETLEHYKDEHVRNEEQVIFARAVQVMDDETLRKISERIAAEKEKTAISVAVPKQRRAPQARF